MPVKVSEEEKAKAKLAKEKEKAKLVKEKAKAKLAKEKEKAKLAKEKEKTKAKLAKAKAKAKLAKAKAKAKAKRVKKGGEQSDLYSLIKIDDPDLQKAISATVELVYTGDIKDLSYDRLNKDKEGQAKQTRDDLVKIIRCVEDENDLLYNSIININKIKSKVQHLRKYSPLTNMEIALIDKFLVNYKNKVDNIKDLQTSEKLNLIKELLYMECIANFDLSSTDADIQECGKDIQLFLSDISNIDGLEQKHTDTLILLARARESDESDSAMI